MNEKTTKLLLLIVHWIIILNFVIEIFYGALMTFVVLSPADHAGGPLFGVATSLDYEDMMVRRMYATETWIAITGLAIYLAITEIRPRMKKLAYPN